MKKVGIMTWYQHRNYGTTLQAVALMEAVRKCGYSPKGIDYISEGYDRKTALEKLCSIRKIKNGVKHGFLAKKYPPHIDALKKKRYDEFVLAYLPMERKTQTASQLFQLNKEYDAFICGSDQIWTPLAYNTKYYLDFVSNTSKKIAYAPSFGVTEIRDRYVKNDIGEQLKTFQAISVREKQAADLIYKNYGLKAEIVLDPTLLMNAEAWGKYTAKAQDSNNKIVCYLLGENDNVWKNIKRISTIKEMDVLVIPVHSKDYYRGFKVLEGVGPAEFLYEISYASFVCTDSFHGTIFSILNHREFVTFKRFSDKDPSSQNSRIINLLETLNLKDHLWNGNLYNKNTEWNKVDEILETLRQHSYRFLRKSLDAVLPCEMAKKEQDITNTCCGCGICTKVCPKAAISMRLIHGFYQAVVNRDICIHCGLCESVCAYNGATGTDLKKGMLYEAKSTDIKVLKRSTSGGISHEILSYLSQKQMPVFACQYDKDEGIVKHILVEEFDADRIQLYQGSKYLQSRFFEGGLQILDLKKGVIAGTPCQIAATDNYLRMKGKRDNYILIDLICHGVPSVNLWRTYLSDENMSNQKVSDVRFRNSEKGWREIYIYVHSSEKTISRKEKKDLFYQFFDMQLCYMKSCYECNYRTSSKADIRLGDYWGKKYTEADLKLGVSMVVAFTEKGSQLLHVLSDEGKIILEERSIKDYYTGQGPVNPIVPVYYEELLEDLEKGKQGLDKLLHKYCYIKYVNKKLQLYKASVKRILKK